MKCCHIGNCLKADPAYCKGVAEALDRSLPEPGLENAFTAI